ncbi:unnamed protein product [Kuraishia capsulata CBS 1993]|uniref:Uncharacterized protein n=1 Tax=Kuraishia capsulata CBS 1993 TaxID=1382522 RepID=W6MX87_9ASCO|nr:uncharacterized protein KUCA_T00004443001 [Kuraishia capsulata CBS 1993]CDK28460.1 unnamed protein product [Kuraishia capsulata CBS 1993]
MPIPITALTAQLKPSSHNQKILTELAVLFNAFLNPSQDMIAHQSKYYRTIQRKETLINRIIASIETIESVLKKDVKSEFIISFSDQVSGEKDSMLVGLDVT